MQTYNNQSEFRFRHWDWSKIKAIGILENYGKNLNHGLHLVEGNQLNER